MELRSLVGTLRQCGRARSVRHGKSFHCHFVKLGLSSDVYYANNLMSMYVESNSLEDAYHLFEQMPVRNLVTWSTIISAYAGAAEPDIAIRMYNLMLESEDESPNGFVYSAVLKACSLSENGSQHALECIRIMHREGFKLDEFTFPCALKSCGSLGSVALGRQVHGYVEKSGFGSSCFSATALVDMYSDCIQLDDATRVFYEYLAQGVSIHESLVLYNSMLSGYVLGGRDKAALEMLSKIHSSGVCMDSYTFSSGLKASFNSLNLRVGLQVHGLATTSGYGLDYVIGSIVIDLYANHGKIGNALRLFHLLPTKDMVAWSGLIVGSAKAGLYSLSYSLFRDMISLGEDVDEFIITSTVKVCSSLVSIRSGKQVHAFCVKNGYLSDGVVATYSIDTGANRVNMSIIGTHISIL
ncbi:hypothetical protein SAY87_014049 [Trapa incisa]|uniref:Pentatricopeptide repeat-containing protein n=1 Tax=Trapa incisa TaxID=236973 RepID=A0AAN7GM66_9MYRT|nr:hypothetical protein SAY87_014049 [Trapa incisa]